METARTPTYGLLAEFPDATSLVEAARRTYADGYRRIDAFSPFPIHELFDAIDAHDRRVPLFVLLGGLVGAAAGFGLCYWVSVIAYPLNIGGRPLNSWPAFIPVTFEVTILIASITAFVTWIGLNGLPTPYHPVFNVPRFAAHGSQDGLFLAIESADPKFDRDRTAEFLRSLGATNVDDIEA